MMKRQRNSGRFAVVLAGRQRIAVLAVLILIAAAVLFQNLAATARDRTAQDAQAVYDRAALTIETWFDRYRALPELYARSDLLRDALADDPQPGGLDAVSRELEAWNTVAGTLDTYLLRTDGVGVAASNWQTDYSFIGVKYDFRPYFTNAMAGKTTGFFGLGTVSGQRGYFLSAPVRQGAQVLGVVVVKVSIEALEESLNYAPHTVYVTDTAGVAIVSGTDSLRMTSTNAVTAEERSAIRRTRRYDLDAIAPSGIVPAPSWRADWTTVRAPDMPEPLLALKGDLTREAWTLNLLYDLAPLSSRLWSIGSAIGASAIALIALVSMAIQRRRRLIERLAERERSQLRLENRVAQRTRDLTDANARLDAEVTERRDAEARLRRTQNELVQAGKLAALGQMSAALSHEFNQPLTAIRTYTENAAAFYEAGRPDRAGENLTRILRLTEKVAQLSRHLTRFARRSGEEMKCVDLDHVIDEALGLLSARIERSDAKIHISGDRGLVVMGGATRLQHVLMNLVSNALDAARDGKPVVIQIDLRQQDGSVVIALTDNGTGIPVDVLPHIFDPFFTTKDVGKGLGLGLSICYNIVRDFDGHLTAENHGGGARFTLTLRTAERHRMAAE